MVAGLGCGEVQVDPDPTLARRGDNGVVLGGAGGQLGAAGAPGPGGATGAGGAPAPSTWSCAATILPPPTATADRPYVFMNFGAACTRAGGECQAATAAYDASGATPPSGTAHFAEECTADQPDAKVAGGPALPGAGFCSTVLSVRPWDTSCRVLHPEQIPLGWICCTTTTSPAVLVPASCGCP